MNDPLESTAGDDQAELARLRELALCLLRGQGYPAPIHEQPELFIQGLPPTMGDALPLPAEIRLLGSYACAQEWDSGLRSQVVQIAFESDQPAAALARFYAEQLRAQGWRTLSEHLERGGFAFSQRPEEASTLSPLIYMRSDQRLTIVLSAGEGGPTTAALELHRPLPGQQGAGADVGALGIPGWPADLAGKQGAEGARPGKDIVISSAELDRLVEAGQIRQLGGFSALMRRTLALPALTPPDHARQEGGASSQSSNRISAETMLELEDGAPDLAALAEHYAAQLRAAGWTPLEASAEGPLASSRWEASDADGRVWRGRLTIVELPATSRRRLRLAMATDGPDDGWSSSSGTMTLIAHYS